MGRQLKGMDQQEVTQVMWAYATKRRIPGRNMWPKLDAAVARVAKESVPQGEAPRSIHIHTFTRTYDIFRRLRLRLEHSFTEAKHARTFFFFF